MRTLRNMLRAIVRPRRTCRDILQQETLNASLAIVLGFGLVVGLLFLRSHLAREYPPPPDELETWIEAWGEFAMLPIVKIPAPQYRLAQALFMVPLSLAIWLLMAGSARVLSVLFRGRTTFVRAIPNRARRDCFSLDGRRFPTKPPAYGQGTGLVCI